MGREGAESPEEMDWGSMIADRSRKWEQMWERYAKEGQKPFSLWENEELPVKHYKDFVPQLLVYPRREEARGCVIVCAGGGFHFKSSNEAKPVADFFYDQGLQTAVLDYNVCPKADARIGEPEVMEAACADVMRAIRIIRYHAKEWGILEDKIATCGFSAGGAVSAMAATRFDYGSPGAEDPIEKMSSRPDAAILVYSSFTADSICGAGENRRYDFDRQKEQVEWMCSELNLRKDSPPFFITQTAYDDPRGSMIWGILLANRGIPFEVHTFEEGLHGCGLYDGKDPDSPLYAHTAKWADLAADWLKMRDF